MDNYDLSQYAEVDHEFVDSVKNMKDDEPIILELQDMEGNPRFEEDGSIASIQLSKDSAEFILQIMREDKASFNDTFVKILTYSVDKYDNVRDDVVNGD